MSSIKITSEYDIDKALVGINPTQHPEAYRLLRALKGIADVERDTGSIYEIAGAAVSNHMKDTKIAQQAAKIKGLEAQLKDLKGKLAWDRQENYKRQRILKDEAELWRRRYFERGNVL